MVKKVICIILTICFALIFVGCQKETKKSNSSSEISCSEISSIQTDNISSQLAEDEKTDTSTMQSSEIPSVSEMVSSEEYIVYEDECTTAPIYNNDIYDYQETSSIFSSQYTPPKVDERGEDWDELETLYKASVEKRYYGMAGIYIVDVECVASNRVNHRYLLTVNIDYYNIEKDERLPSGDDFIVIVEYMPPDETCDKYRMFDIEKWNGIADFNIKNAMPYLNF